MQINQYTNEAFLINDEDYYDVDYWDGAAYQSRKISGLTLKSILGSLATNIYNSDGTLTADRTITGDNFVLFFQELGQFVVHSHKNNTDNVIFEVRSQSGFESFTIRDHNTGDHLFCVENGQIEFNNAYKFPTTTGSLNQVLMLNASNELIWASLTDTNIYNSDGTLTGTRTLTLGGFTLGFTDALGTVKIPNGNTLSVTGASNTANILLQSDSSYNKNIEFSNSGTTRWRILTSNTETGSNVGTDFFVNSYDDAGAFLETIISAKRSTGRLKINNAYELPKVDGTSGQVLTTNGLGDVSWQGINGWTQITKSADQDVTNSGTFTDDTELQFSVVAAGQYMVEFHICYSGNDTAGDYKAAFAVGTGTMSGSGGAIALATGGGTVVSGVLVNGTAVTSTIPCGVNAAALTHMHSLYGSFSFYASANTTFKFQFANNTAAAGRISRTNKGSILKYKKIN